MINQTNQTNEINETDEIDEINKEFKVEEKRRQRLEVGGERRILSSKE
ncbi:MAG: hypothetical protein GTN76_05915 [Candidatus Aenigmarchaeota archaeon]|nr:hypothetical protein [Candidatus Aenigmarchaeota archaeon]